MYGPSQIDLPEPNKRPSFWCNIFGCNMGSVQVLKEPMHYFECKRCGSRDYVFTLQFNLSTNKPNEAKKQLKRYE